MGAMSSVQAGLPNNDIMMLKLTTVFPQLHFASQIEAVFIFELKPAIY